MSPRRLPSEGVNCKLALRKFHGQLRMYRLSLWRTGYNVVRTGQLVRFNRTQTVKNYQHDHSSRNRRLLFSYAQVITIVSFNLLSSDKKKQIIKQLYLHYVFVYYVLPSGEIK
jgi:hypothetical protein